MPAPETPLLAWQDPERLESRPVQTMLSISVAGLINLLSCLSGLPWFRSGALDKNLITSNHIRDYLLAGGAHPARLFPDCFSRSGPVAALTYEWRLTFGDVLSFLNPIQIGETNAQHGCSIPASMAQLLVWIDVFFIDQLSADIGSNLLLAQRIYAESQYHLALATSTVCTRAWCLFEVPQPSPARANLSNSFTSKRTSTRGLLDQAEPC